MSHWTTRNPAGNPIANILVIIAGALIVGVSVVLGFFAFLVLGGIVLISAAVIGIRVWWFNRRHARGTTSAMKGARKPGGVIEGEYRVVRKDQGEP